MARFVAYILLMFLTTCYANKDDNSLEEDTIIDRTTLSSLKLPSDLSVPHNIVQFLVSAGAVVLGIVGLVIIANMVLPLFGVKLCYLLGTCDHLGTTFVPSQPLGGVGQAYDYSTSGTFNNPNAGYASGSYQRRSLDYVGPILKMLSTAYDKYASAAVKGAAVKNTPEPSTKMQ